MPKTTNAPSSRVGTFLHGAAQVIDAAADYAESRALSAQAAQVAQTAGSLRFKNKSKKRRSKNKKTLRRKYKINKRRSRRSTIGGFRRRKRKSLRKKYKRKYKRRNSRRRR
jgi:hypothetical protein